MTKQETKAELRARLKRDTDAWSLTAADRKAVAAGMFFDASRGREVCDWIEENCYLYEGAHAGEPMKLIPYQREFLMRLFSWVYWSDEWKDFVRRFTRATLLCAKKNGKTPLLAAVGLYLLIADGENGQKVYIAAKNGKQAQITQQHAIAMVEQSPNLKDPVCTINKTTLEIRYPLTRSRMMILTGDDSAGAKATEGINGSVIIDELHVFSREVHERTSRAGRSRKEPLNFAVSTAGDDPSSYGFQRVQQGRMTNEGKGDDLGHLFAEFAAPQTATDETIAANLEDYIRAANPGLGHTCMMSTLKDDYEQSKDIAREMANFKQYTLNLWIGSASPWLSVGNWAKGKKSFTLEELRGRECKLGLDMSRTRDMTAAVLTFPMPEEGEEVIQIWPMFWLPEDISQARKHLFPYPDWAEHGELTLTPGNVVDYNIVENELCAAIEEADITVTDLFYDQHYAEEISQRLSDRLNCNRTAVSQTLMTLSPLCKELERRIDAECVIHPGNAVLDWQVGHVQVWRDRNQNVRPVKPDASSGKSIDGIMAVLDTFAGVCEDSVGDSSGGLTFL